KLAAMPGVKGVSGKGMMIGISLEEGLTPADITRRCAAKGLITLTAKEKVRFLPPLTISYDEIDRGLAIFKEALAEALNDNNDKGDSQS
ncbi:MAG: aminotransferase class III-fold pyridoxal phosphate-dependent enzyme, partial [Oscillospiraceae bacterium]|nr:aminotransferase class III-fold pyridoxal phosphate-dependent enzyme [Oscillospiraceae bacterium]